MTKQERRKKKLIRRLEKDYELIRKYLKLSPSSGEVKYNVSKAILRVKGMSLNNIKD